MAYNVLLVAVGGIGFRHFQAILNCTQPIKLFVVDIDNNALQRAREYADTLKIKPEIVYSQDISSIPEHIHAAVIATSSMPRRSVFESLIASHTVDNVIFEKVAFPKLEDYAEIGKILKEKHIKAFVDCPARMFDVYKWIKDDSKDCNYFNAFMKGSNWGLACNAIHLIDQVAYMSGADTSQVICSGDFEDEIVESKRRGYIEFYGKLIGSIGEKCFYVIECDHGDHPLEFEFLTDKAYYYVNEGAGILKKVLLCQAESVETKSITIPYVSQLTNINIDKLLQGKEIDLARFEESRPLHEALISTFLTGMYKINGTKTDICPIT